MSLNQKYLNSLAKRPLLTKAVTAGTLASLNEILATCFLGLYQQKRITVFGKERTIKHVFTPKILLMVVYGALIATPISHYYYHLLNRVFKGKLLPRMKLLQLLASLCTVSPLLSGIYVSWLSLINTYRCTLGGVTKEVAKMLAVIKGGLKSNFWLVYRTSAVTSVVAMSIAQNLVPPELWVVFFNVIYFVVGTVQNTKIKRRQRAAAEALRKAELDKAEKLE